MTFEQWWETADKDFSKYAIPEEIEYFAEQAWNAAVGEMLDEGYQIVLDNQKGE